jgi:hypothetical protein
MAYVRTAAENLNLDIAASYLVSPNPRMLGILRSTLTETDAGIAPGSDLDIAKG